jgi:hypothetical protein
MFTRASAGAIELQTTMIPEPVAESPFPTD